jgi:hypothetical protein
MSATIPYPAHEIDLWARQFVDANTERKTMDILLAIMGAIHGLSEISDLDSDPALGIGQWPEIADVTIATNPDRRPLRQLAGAALQPLVKLQGAASNISMSGQRHLQVAHLEESGLATTGARHSKRRECDRTASHSRGDSASSWAATDVRPFADRPMPKRHRR